VIHSFPGVIVMLERGAHIGHGAVLHGCTIHGGKRSGVFVTDKGRGELTGCTLFGHTFSELTVRGGNPVLRRCRLRHRVCRDTTGLNGSALHCTSRYFLPRSYRWYRRAPFLLW